MKENMINSSFPLVPQGYHREYGAVLQNSEAFATICVGPFTPKPFNSLSSLAWFLLTGFNKFSPVTSYFSLHADPHHILF